ncbi:MAG: hypothetical protein HUJ51_02420 [Eggerthellaceae bacterium]|nr:hypothetical protein [Eggerthellaceae bacterium]
MAFVTQMMGLLASIVLFILLIYIAWRVCTIVGFWHIFKKGGEKPWKAVIPFYCEYTAFKLFWSKNIFWSWLTCTLLSGIIISFFASGPANTVSVVQFVSVIISITATVLLIMLYYRISKSFGHGIGYLFGMIFATPVFAIILGFEKSKFIKGQNRFCSYKKEAAPTPKPAPKLTPKKPADPKGAAQKNH